MSQHTAEIEWLRGEQPFTDNRYSRRHEARFDGGAVVPASSSPHVVPLPMSDASAVDPEEALVWALASCHMLFFLGFAARDGWRVDRYVDRAEGRMARGTDGVTRMTDVWLRPAVRFSGDRLPTREAILALHDESHHACYIANSVRSAVHCEPVFEDEGACASASLTEGERS